MGSEMCIRDRVRTRLAESQMNPPLQMPKRLKSQARGDGVDEGNTMDPNPNPKTLSH